jgi:pimeloyl-ACP methyl ester carboxylesterase
MGRLTTHDVTLDVDDVGVGDDVVVFVHGHPFNRTMWTPQHEAVRAAGWRVVAPDLRGYGASTVTAGIVTLDVFATDLVAVLDHLAIQRVVLVGLSMGGQIAMEFARRTPDRLRGLVLAATFPRPETGDGRARRQAMADRLLAEGMAGYADEVLPRMLAPASLAARPAVGDAVLRMMRTTDPRGAAAALRGRAERPDYRPVLDQLAVPSLIVVGSADAFTTADDANEMATRLAGGRLVWLEGIGHMPNLEAPERFNRELVAFLRQVASR